MTSFELRRREFLKTLKLGLCALPTLPEFSLAAPGGAPVRLLTVIQTGGVIQPAFFPTGGTGTDLSTYRFPAIIEPLKPYTSALNLVKGLTQRNFKDNFPRSDRCGNNPCSDGGAHESYATLFSAKRARAEYVGEVRGFMQSHCNGPTLDRWVGKRLSAAGAPPPLTLGVVMNKQGTAETQCRASYDDVRKPQAPQDDTKKLFDMYFAGRPSGPNPELERLRVRRKSLLDAVGKDLERFSVRAGQEYKYKVDAHLTAIRELERLISTPASAATCSVPAIPAFNPNDLSQYDKALEAQLRFIAAAFACDAARVISLQTSNAHGNEIVFSWLGLQGRGLEYAVRNYHDIQHRPGSQDADKIKVDQWFMSRLAFLLELMSNVKEGNRTLLDNSAVLWANHAGNGGAHSSTDLPWVLAGAAGGAIRTGQFINAPNGTHTGAILTALCKAMGVPADSTFADAEYNQPMSALLA
jgi:hypothetical protein